MKKYLLLTTVLLIVAIVFTGCTKADIPKDENIPKENSTENIKPTEEDARTIKDYYPFKENTKMEYEGIGNEYAEQETFFEFIKDNRAQIKIFNSGTVIAKVLEYNDGELREVFTEGEFYHIENMLDTDSENNNVILKEPLKVGTTWNISGGHKKTITGVDVDIETPYKKFKALEVTTELGEGRKQFDYYVVGIGHVASIYKDGDFEVKTLLKDIKNKPYETEVRLYYPSATDIETLYLDRDIQFSTNGDIQKILESNLQNPESDELMPTISKNTKINSIKLDRGNRIVNVDFSKELLTDMNAGSAMEEEILKSIVNTFGNYYGVEKVYISVDGAPYSSGHFGLEENEYFTVDYDNVQKFE
jgi:hypothetical protein